MQYVKYRCLAFRVFTWHTPWPTFTSFHHLSFTTLILPTQLSFIPWIWLMEASFPQALLSSTAQTRMKWIWGKNQIMAHKWWVYKNMTQPHETFHSYCNYRGHLSLQLSSFTLTVFYLYRLGFSPVPLSVSAFERNTTTHCNSHYSSSFAVTEQEMSCSAVTLILFSLQIYTHYLFICRLYL